MGESDRLEGSPEERFGPASVSATPNCEEEKVPISAAILAFGNPEKVVRYKELRAEIAGRRETIILLTANGEPVNPNLDFGAIRRGNYLIRERRRFWKELYRDFLQQVSCGELIASGFRYPLSPLPREEDLMLQLWQFVHPYNGNVVKGGGIKFISVRVRRAPAVPLSKEVTALIASDGSRSDPSDHGKPVRRDGAEVVNKRKPKKSLTKLYELELRRRAAEGQLESTWGHQSRALQVWFASAHPHEKPLVKKTLGNQLRSLYGELMRRL